MSKTKKIIIAAAVIILAIPIGFQAYKLLSPIFINVELQEELPAEFQVITPEIPPSTESQQAAQTSNTNTVAQITHKGIFERIDYDVTGSFQVIKNNQKALLRINDLDITNGPDLFLVVSNDNSAFGNNDFEIIAPLPANQGSYNVEIPENINLDEYKYLLIHCKQFVHTFAGATIHSST